MFTSVQEMTSGSTVGICFRSPSLALLRQLFSSATSTSLFGPYSPLQFVQQEVSPAPSNYQNNTGTLEDGPQVWTQGPQPLDPWQSCRGGGDNDDNDQPLYPY